MNFRYKTLEIRYVNRTANEVFLVWGINHWSALPEDRWPVGSFRNVRGHVSTPMNRGRDTFTATVRIPDNASFQYGFQITELRSGKPVFLWDEQDSRSSVVLHKNKDHLTIRSWLKLLRFTLHQKTAHPEQSAGNDDPLQEFSFPGRTYTRFILLSQGRTGSSYLQFLLDSHPQVRMHSELFHKEESERQKHSSSVGRTIAENDNPVDYLNNHVYRHHPADIRAVGFKILYGHAVDPAWQIAWDYLQASCVSVIHLKRRNLLDRYLSSQLALRSRQWLASSPDDVKPYNSPISLDPDACIEDIFNTLYSQAQHDQIFRDNPKIEVFYEDLVDNQDQEMGRILTFLHADPGYQLSSASVKQRIKTKSDLIANYEELKRKILKLVREGRLPQDWTGFLEA